MLIYYAKTNENQIWLYFVNNTGKTITSISWVVTVNGVDDVFELNCHDSFENSNRIYRYHFNTRYADFDYASVHIESVAVRFQDGTVQENVELKEGGYRILQACVDADRRKSTPYYQEDGGCYVATAVYGSYDCPQVWTLRRYRDYTLAKTWYGRAFIHTYYAISPTLVKWFGHTEWFKRMWKGKLDRMVASLNAAGVEDTPYKDCNW